MWNLKKKKKKANTSKLIERQIRLVVTIGQWCEEEKQQDDD